jgi:hypothetical protein
MTDPATRTNIELAAEINNMHVNFAERPFILLLVKLVEPKSASLASKLRSVITTKDTAMAVINIKDSPNDMPQRICITLAIVEKDKFQMDIPIPSDEYARDVIMSCHALKTSAIAYMLQFREDYKELHDECAAVLGLKELEFQIDKNKQCVLYFKDDHEYGLGTYGFVTDSEGKPFGRKKH